MTDLLARLQVSTGADRELANDVLLACGWKTDEMGSGPERKLFWVGPNEEYIDGDQPDPTRSIDAALALVPSGWTRSVDASAPYMGIDVDLYAPDHKGAARGMVGCHENEAIATCIAALKARGAVQQSTKPEELK